MYLVQPAFFYCFIWYTVTLLFRNTVFINRTCIMLLRTYVCINQYTIYIVNTQLVTIELLVQFILKRHSKPINKRLSIQYILIKYVPKDHFDNHNCKNMVNHGVKNYFHLSTLLLSTQHLPDCCLLCLLCSSNMEDMTSELLG